MATSIGARERGRGAAEERAEGGEIIGWKGCRGMFCAVIRLCFFEVVGYRMHEASFWRALVCDFHGTAATTQRTRRLHELVVFEIGEFWLILIANGSDVKM